MSSLFTHIQNRTLVDATKFVDVSKLSGHRFYNYQVGGAQGLANDEAKEIRDELLSVRIEAMRETAKKFESNADFLKSTALVIEAVGREARIIGRSYSKVIDSFRGEINNSVSQSIFKIQAFNFFTGCFWGIAVDLKKEINA